MIAVRMLSSNQKTTSGWFFGLIRHRHYLGLFRLLMRCVFAAPLAELLEF